VTDAEAVKILSELGVQSTLTLPLLAQERALGVFTLVIGDSERHFEDKDLAIAEELACRVAPLIDIAKLHHELQQANAELEDRLQERTVDVLAANKKVEALSYSVSRDLRVPLWDIDRYSQALIEASYDALDGKGQELLRRIQAESQRLGLLIDDMIGLSHITRAEMHMATVDLSEIVVDIAVDLKLKEPERNVIFTIQDGVTAYGDERLIRIALENLIGNAWKFTSKKMRARIEFGSHKKNGPVEYYIRDNGVGFNMAYADKLFGAFQRLHPATEYEGAGIGLAAVERIVQRHGGTVRAEGEVNVGATFYFTFAEK
jgi:light-regulated signal transduction histidine kinase (bacteriophytochrome)